MVVQFAPIALTAVLASLATVGLESLLANKNNDGSYTVTSDGRPIMTLPREFFLAQDSVDNLQKPLDRARAILSRTLSTGSSKPNPANISLKIPFKKRRLLALSLRPDAIGKTNGNAEVFVNGELLLTIPDASLTDVDVLNIPLPE